MDGPVHTFQQICARPTRTWPSTYFSAMQQRHTTTGVLPSIYSLLGFKLQPLEGSSPEKGMCCVMFTVTAISASLGQTYLNQQTSAVARTLCPRGPTCYNFITT